MFARGCQILRLSFFLNPYMVVCVVVSKLLWSGVVFFSACFFVGGENIVYYILIVSMVVCDMQV